MVAKDPHLLHGAHPARRNRPLLIGHIKGESVMTTLDGSPHTPCLPIPHLAFCLVDDRLIQFLPSRWKALGQHRPWHREGSPLHLERIPPLDTLQQGDKLLFHRTSVPLISYPTAEGSFWFVHFSTEHNTLTHRVFFFLVSMTLILSSPHSSCIRTRVFPRKPLSLIRLAHVPSL